MRYSSQDDTTVFQLTLLKSYRSLVIVEARDENDPYQAEAEVLCDENRTAVNPVTLTLITSNFDSERKESQNLDG